MTNRQELFTATKIAWYIYSVAGMAVLVSVFLLPVDFVLQNTPTCYSVKLYNRECFMCGSTRSFLLAGQGKFAQAAQMNKLALVLFTATVINTMIFLYIIVINLIKRNK